MGASNYRQSNHGDAATSTSLAVAFPSNIGAGKRLITVGLIDYRPSLGGTLTLSDTLGTTYTQRTTATLLATLAIYIYDGIAIAAGGANTVTADYGATTQTSIVMAIAEYADMLTANAFDAANSATGNSAALDSGAFTAALNGELVVGFGLDGNTSISAGTNETFTSRENWSNPSFRSWQDALKSVAGSTNAQFTGGTSGNWMCAGACYKRRYMVNSPLNGIGPFAAKSHNPSFE